MASFEVGWVEAPNGLSPAAFGELPLGYQFKLNAKGREQLVNRACSNTEMGVPEGLKFRQSAGPPDYWIPLRVHRRVVSSILKIAGPWDWNGDQWITVFFDAEVSEVTALGKRLGYPRSVPAAFSGPGAEVATFRLHAGRWTLVRTG